MHIKKNSNLIPPALNSLRKKIGLWLLKKDVKPLNRNLKPVNLSNARTVGLLFLINDRNNYEQVHKFTQYLHEQHKNVKVIAYLNEKNAPSYYTPNITFEILTKKNISFFGIPKREKINTFVTSEFDMLIDLTEAEILPLRYIAALSKARFKVGRGEKNASIYDFMFNLKASASLNDYISTIKSYLLNFNIK